MTEIATDTDGVADEVARRLASGMRRRDLLRSTPGQWGVLLLVLVVAALVVGLVTALSVHSRQRTLGELATTTGPLRTAAAEFHRALSTADMAAAVAFVARDQDRAIDRVTYETEYETAIGEAQSALAALVAARDGNTDPQQRNLLRTLPGRLSEYTVLMETARAYNREREPVASTYQLLAADAMRAHLLPAARELQEAARARMADAQRAAMSFPALELVLIGLLLAGLVTAQVWLRRRTNRMFNVGLLVATAAAVAMLAWTTIGAIVSGSYAETSAQQGTELGDTLTDARVTALAARSNEGLLLVAARDGHDTGPYRLRFAELRQRLVGRGAGTGVLQPGVADADYGGELAVARVATDDEETRDQVDDAAAAAEVWLAQHDTLLSTAGIAQAGAAETLLGSPGAESFTTVDDSLSSAGDDARQVFNDAVEDARTALTGMTFGVVLLSALTALAAGAGVWQRLREYR